ncbi:Uncharacterized protein HZ326_23299 [Fusarium oxysporum f. sp. albedinis]|nr:Uncharacterized protein HZ326_23299 [Fusarium oxysporum f. sp. albedinis]
MKSFRDINPRRTLISIINNQVQLIFSLSTTAQDKQHESYTSLQTESSFWTRLRRTDKFLMPCTRPKFIQQRFNQEQMPPLQTASKEEMADAFLHWV